MKDLLASAIDDLKLSGVNNPLLDAEVLLAYVLGCERVDLIIKDFELTEAQKDQFLKLIKERKEHKPIAYIIGLKEFWGLDFKVTQDVLIPRPETELIVENVCNIFYDKQQHLKILDLGTGSGCLAIALLKEYKNSQCYAVDLSKEALKIAEENALNHNVYDRLKTFCGSWFAPLPDGIKFDIVVSNPPYIDPNEKLSLKKEVYNFEPSQALFGENNGLLAYEEIAQGVKSFIRNNSVVFLEIGYNQGELVKKIMHNNGFNNVSIKRDLAGLDRLIITQCSNC